MATSLALILMSGTSMQAADVLFGIGSTITDEADAGQAAFQLEVHSDPIKQYNWGTVSGLALAEVDDKRAVYTGLGLAALWRMSGNWFLEGSVAIGHYDRGSQGRDLGGSFQVRSLVGIGYQLSRGGRVSMALSHLSNAGTQAHNPGREAITVRYSVPF